MKYLLAQQEAAYVTMSDVECSIATFWARRWKEDNQQNLITKIVGAKKKEYFQCLHTQIISFAKKIISLPMCRFWFENHSWVLTNKTHGDETRGKLLGAVSTQLKNLIRNQSINALRRDVSTFATWKWFLPMMESKKLSQSQQSGNLICCQKWKCKQFERVEIEVKFVLSSKSLAITLNRFQQFIFQHFSKPIEPTTIVDFQGAFK